MKDNNEYKLVKENTERYSDFLHTFLPHPNTGQITRKVNVDAVKMSIRNILLTNKYERLRNPEFGTNLNRFLFEPFIESTGPEMETHIRHAIERYEPRAKVIDVSATPAEDDLSMFITIIFSIMSDQSPHQVDLTLYRVR